MWMDVRGERDGINGAVVYARTDADELIGYKHANSHTRSGRPGSQTARLGRLESPNAGRHLPHSSMNPI
jgi:hypothetical protein